jgi:uncharacterized membrane protein YfcA
VIWAWCGAALVGLSLGLLGSGGAILTVPILVYLVGHDEKTAIAESLAIVGAIALAGALRAAARRRLDFGNALLLGVPGIIGTYAGATAARYIPGAMQLVMLAVLMLTAAVLMFLSGRSRAAAANGAQPVEIDATAEADERHGGDDGPGGASRAAAPRTIAVIAAQGVGLGIATGLVGIGGGFLIVPMLVLIRRVPMATAIGTSLAIIALNSATGFAKYLTMMGKPAGPGGQIFHVDWHIVAVFSAVGVIGSLVGGSLAGVIPQRTLKRIFAMFLVGMAAYILVRQAPRVMPGVFGGQAAVMSQEAATGTVAARQAGLPWGGRWEGPPYKTPRHVEYAYCRLQTGNEVGDATAV